MELSLGKILIYFLITVHFNPTPVIAQFEDFISRNNKTIFLIRNEHYLTIQSMLKGRFVSERDPPFLVNPIEINL